MTSAPLSTRTIWTEELNWHWSDPGGMWWREHVGRYYQNGKLLLFIRIRRFK